jgi:hypothetical protein
MMTITPDDCETSSCGPVTRPDEIDVDEVMVLLNQA